MQLWRTRKIDEVHHVPMPRRILFLGVTNTCRSVMLECLFKRMLRERLGENMGQIKVSSAGLDAFDYSPPVENARIILSEHGVDCSKFKSTPLEEKLVEAVDVMLAVSERVKMRTVKRIPEAKGKVFTLREYAGSRRDMNDPMGRPIEKYRQCVNTMQSMLEKLFLKVIR
ncbi:MAG: hypothetical protein ACE5PO_07500 [Candidatus Bathyarchaeia archaeon]